MLRKLAKLAEDLFVPFLIGFAFTLFMVFMINKPGEKPSREWWATTIFTGIFTIQLTRWIQVKLFRKQTKTPDVPEKALAFDEAIKSAEYNFFAISSKSILLWETNTFLHYLMLNTIKNIIEFSATNRGVSISFSSDEEARRQFFDEGFDILESLANNEVPPKFFGLRLLIYPKHVYEQFASKIEHLISIHALGRIHCIPVIRDRLLEKLPKELVVKMNEFAIHILDQQKIIEELTHYSIWDILQLTFFPQKTIYATKIPDFLMINCNFQDPTKSQLWWFQGKEAQRKIYKKNEKECFQNAHDIIKGLAQTIIENWDSVIWNQFTAELIPRVPVPSRVESRQIDFFSLPYFNDWLDLIKTADTNSPFSQLKKWFYAEEDILKKEICKNPDIKKVLDVGCGWGRHLEVLLEGGIEEVAGVDISPAMVEKADELHEKFPDKHIDIRLENATNLRFPDNCFDAVICMTNTFGNFGRAKTKALNEMCRVLRPGGLLVLSVYKDTREALTIRKQSYEAIGLRPVVNQNVVYTIEGLISEQFSQEELRKALQARKLIDIRFKEIHNLAFIAIARKPPSTSSHT